MQPAANEKDLDCPLCIFTADNQHHLLLHVETAHAEDAQSFHLPGGKFEKDSNVEEEVQGCTPNYVECECGEWSLASETGSHLDMHYAEGMTFDETKVSSLDLSASESTLCRGKALSPSHRVGPSIVKREDISTPQTTTSPRFKTGRRLRGESRKSQGLVQDLINALRHSSPLPSKKPSRTENRRIPQRLGRKELGPHAHEERMPEWLRRQLELGAKVTVVNQINLDGRLVRVETVANEFCGIVPVLAQLCDQDPTLSMAFLCHPSVTHVVKMSKEGGFCGYRNIQMLISYIRDSHSHGCERFPGRLPSIIKLQDVIENAWDRGFNSLGRIETGGIRGTRKYIGTPEAQALLESLDIGCKAESFNSGASASVQHQLLDAVEKYFFEGHNRPSRKVSRTSLPPIYFQHPGHSLTIVGLEVRKDGSRNLLVFDPMFKPSPGIHRLIGTQFRASDSGKLLKAYRRGEAYLKYSSYELLRLTSSMSPEAGWESL